MKHTAFQHPVQPPALACTEEHLEEFLRRIVSELPEEGAAGSSGPGRPAELSERCLWSAFVVCVLRGLHSQKAVWRLLGMGPLWQFTHSLLTAQAVYQRLDHGGTAALQRLFGLISNALASLVSELCEQGEREGTLPRLAPFAPQIVALDETILDQVARRLPILRYVARGSILLLPGKLVCLFNIRTQQWQRIHYEADSLQNEKVCARLMLQSLQQGTLLLFDLGYFCFQWFDELTSQGFYYISRIRSNSAIRVLHAFYEQGDTLDALVFLGTPKGAHPRYAVRLVRFQMHGVLHSYICNVCDPAQLCMHDIAVLYARRWDIECAFLLLKKHLGLMWFWSAKVHVVLQQVWAALIIAQLLQALRLRVAVHSQHDPYEVSMALLLEYLPTLSDYHAYGLALLLSRGSDLGFIRSSSRVRIQTPDLRLLPYHPLPPEIVREQVPKYPPDPGKARKRSPKKRKPSTSSQQAKSRVKRTTKSPPTSPVS